VFLSPAPQSKGGLMALVSVQHLTRIFDVSKPWLNREIERRE
jgi:hypothetical protein